MLKKRQLLSDYLIRLIKTNGRFKLVNNKFNLVGLFLEIIKYILPIIGKYGLLK